MLQATATLMAEEQGRLLSPLDARRDGIGAISGLVRRELQRGIGYSFTTRLRNRVCSDGCLKFVYLSCATLISASFIIECILLHLIVAPYLSESVFELSVCKFRGSQSSYEIKKCENKCSKERSTFPCLQLRVFVTPLRTVWPANWDNRTWFAPVLGEDKEMAGTAESLLRTQNESRPFGLWITQTNYDIPPNAWYDFSSPGTRTVYLYDYFSTFTAHGASKCSTSPCHRREVDNYNAVKEFRLMLWHRHMFFCFARPFAPTSVQQNVGDHSTDSSVSIVQRTMEIPQDPKDAAAILHNLYTWTMFMHSLFWPGGVFVVGLAVLLFTYAADGCQVWARDKTVIA